MTEQRLDVALRRAVEAAKAPGAVAYVGDLERVYFHGATGFRQTIPAALPADPGTLYDLASLTKTVATATATLMLYEEGRIDLDAPVTEFLSLPVFHAVTIRHLLNHTSGLVSGLPYYRDCSSVDAMLLRYAERGLDREPGARRVYSDAGFMLLGRIVEVVSGAPLDAFCAARIFEPLGMARTGFNPPEEWVENCAATEKCKWRERIMIGEVHDENAFAVGGVSGHAGLFSTAGDLAKYCRALLKGELLQPKTLAMMTELGQVPSYPWQGLGWWLDPWGDSSNGGMPARAVFGHTGWTGTCLWLDRETGLFTVLLSNTCHPMRNDRNNRALRRPFYAEVTQLFYPRTAATHTGLDRLLYEKFNGLRGKRIALLTNHSAVDQLGRHILDVLDYAEDVELHLLYSPEHGLFGQEEAGAKVGAQKSRVPVISLYDNRRYPSPDELAEIHVFVIDLQDVGSRYYTYIATMKDCLEACGKAKKPVLILDRPNPVGGDVLEGPVAENTNSPVSCAPIPVRHGMTIGEAALYFVQHVLQGPKPQVAVHTMDNWRRALTFDACALPWVPPSPNMPTPDTALLYVGMCLFEGTNLNEGRGTDTPFEVIGAPWLDAENVIAALPAETALGCSLEPTRYEPRAIPGKATNPRYKGLTCNGIRIRVTDGEIARPFTLALALLIEIRARHAKFFEWNKMFDTLAGGPKLRQQIEAGATALALAQSFDGEQRAFKAKRILRYG